MNLMQLPHEQGKNQDIEVDVVSGREVLEQQRHVGDPFLYIQFRKDSVPVHVASQY
jgi:hypothetical protein